MERMVGTVARGLRAPIIREGDDLEQIVVDTILKASKAEGFAVRDRDVVAVTESIVARSEGNYVSVDQIAADVRNKLGGGTVGVVFPILSRNRFAICLRGIARGAKKVIVQLSYPGDEVGNKLVEEDLVEEKGIDPHEDVLTQAQFEKLFGSSRHIFTGVDYINYYKNLIQSEGAEAQVILGNDPRAILGYARRVLACDIHTRQHTKKLLLSAGAELVYGMDDLMSASVDGSGFNTKYGLLGSNRSTEDVVKLFPNDCSDFVNHVQQKVKEATGKTIEVMVYGDGAFKDPVGKIWELADPVVSPGYTAGLEGTPNEIKLKYLADNDFADLKGASLEEAVSEAIKEKKSDVSGTMAAQGTTPRRLTDLIGSLCDLTSGSGDKGTPFVYIQGYFDNFTD